MGDLGFPFKACFEKSYEHHCFFEHCSIYLQCIKYKWCSNMGIAERKEREREEVKDLILNAAREIFLTEGYENTSIRKIASKIEYSPGVIYLHFKDKNDLLLALHDKAFECKMNSLFHSTQHIADPLERLRGIGIGYLQYGIDNPQDYELMFI